MPPRRSSRARPTQSANSFPQSQSSSSSTSSGRAERHTRSHTKAASPRKVITPRSASSEDAGDLAAPGRDDHPHTRRQKRVPQERDDALTRNPSQSADAEAVDDEDEDEEEEVTRCVCGQPDYPGPSPTALADARLRAKDETSPHSPLDALDPSPDELGSLFIQCDTCKVWQHGGCVGIMEVTMSPDEYFCELCRRDLHKIISASKGPRSSRYLPVVGRGSPKASRSASLPQDGDPKPSKGKSGGQASATHSGKRRSTMNSRDAAYDEEEQLRRAIEESKAEKKTGNAGSVDRRGKRERSESEETKQSVAKRQRTTSESASSASQLQHQHHRQGPESDGEPPDKSAATNPPKRARGAAARQGREKDLRDRAAERDKEREEAAGRRKGRAERRRAEDSDPEDDAANSRPPAAKQSPESTAQAREAPVGPKPEKETPATQAPAPSTTGPQRKSGRPQARRGRVGRNQYTKDRDLGREVINGKRDTSAARSRSRDGLARDEPKNNTAGAAAASSSHGPNAESSSGRPSRPRYMNPQRTTMNEMKRRVAAILEFISRIQVEMAGEKTPPSSGTNSAAATTTTTTAMLKAVTRDLPKITLTGEGGGPGKAAAPASTTPINNHNKASNAATAAAAASAAAAADVFEKEFGELNSMEMMDVLTRKLVLWQKEYGKWGDK